MELGDDLLSGNYKFDGLGYVMDKPLSQLLANGWSLADDAPITFPFSIINCQDIFI